MAVSQPLVCCHAAETSSPSCTESWCTYPIARVRVPKSLRPRERNLSPMLASDPWLHSPLLSQKPTHPTIISCTRIGLILGLLTVRLPKAMWSHPKSKPITLEHSADRLTYSFIQRKCRQFSDISVHISQTGYGTM